MSRIINTIKKKLDANQEAMLQKLEAYDLSFVYEKLLTDKKIEKKDIPALDIEFKKFIALAGLNIFPIAMISPLLDEVWHQFILFTKQYKQFCLNTVGFYVDHLPDTSKTPVPVIAGENLRTYYQSYFGKIDDIWFKGMDKELLAYYAQPVLTHKPPQLWSGWTGPQE